MSKVKLGPKKGSVDDKEFDIADNVLQIVKEYERCMNELELYKIQKIRLIEEEVQRKKEMLRASLVSDLGVKLTGKP